MYTVSHYQGYNEPLDVELLESCEGEAREIIFQNFIDEGMFTDTVFTIDESNEDGIELYVTDWLTAAEIEQLQYIEKYVTESFWDALTIETLVDAIKHARNEREAT